MQHHHRHAPELRLTGRGRWPGRLLALLAVGLAGSGCAKFPAEIGGGGPTRLLDLRLTVRGDLDPNGYYLFVIDTNQEEFNGPEIIAPRTEFLGNGRATGSYTHYVEYHQGRFEVFRDQPERPGQIVPPREALGQPFFFDSTSSAGTLSVSVDLNTLKANANDPDFRSLQLNFITVNQIVLPGENPVVPRQTDGLGQFGTSFISAQLENGLIITNTGIENAGEIFDGQQLEAAYDLTDFRIAYREGN